MCSRGCCCAWVWVLGGGGAGAGAGLPETEGPSASVKGHSDREAKGVAPRLVEPLGEVKKGVDPPRVLDVELPRGVMSYTAPPLRLKPQHSNRMMGLGTGTLIMIVGSHILYPMHFTT